METLECIKSRRSVRRFTDSPVEQDIMNRIISAAVYAPSWKNTQTARYTIINTPEIIERISLEAMSGFNFNQKTLAVCRTLAVLTYEKNISGYEADGTASTPKGHDWEVFDAGISAQTFCLAAHDLGVGTVIMGIFDENKVKNILSIPKSQDVAALIACGYPKFEPDFNGRKPVDEIVRYL